jgi:bifunctional UDP-N-acetylglucosamine pyrophosphorylase/glucosamine-1-phosphate N-acetyltransferase
MLHWVIEAARTAGADRVVCVTRPGEGVAEAVPDGIEVAEQRTGEGTGAAVLAGRELVDGAGTVIVLSGDHPLVSAELIAGLRETHQREQAAATLLTTEDIDPRGYGRIVRAPDGSVERIVETKHVEGVPPEELAIREINIGTYAFEADDLYSALEAVGETHAERYLTGVFPVLKERGEKVAALTTHDTLSAMGVNDRADLIAVTRQAHRKIVERHARAGVTFTAPDTVAIDADVEIGADTTIELGVTLKGQTRIGERCRIGPQATITNSELQDGVTALHAVLIDCRVADSVTIGPFAYLRPEADVRDGAKVGTFVEVKKSVVGAGAKIPHLSYIGDADIGERANVGGGAITANYHRGKKNRTTIGEEAKTGVHNSFVAPVRVGDRAYTAAGSVIADDVPDEALGISRPPQKNIEGYAKRLDEDSRE